MARLYQQHYMWIPYILKKLKVMETFSPVDQLPAVRKPLRKEVKGLRNIGGDNFPISLFVLGEHMWFAGIAYYCSKTTSRCFQGNTSPPTHMEL